MSQRRSIAAFICLFSVPQTLDWIQIYTHVLVQGIFLILHEHFLDTEKILGFLSHGTFDTVPNGFPVLGSAVGRRDEGDSLPLCKCNSGSQPLHGCDPCSLSVK